MTRFKISAERKEQTKRIAIAVLREPKAIIAIGALILTAGMYITMRIEPLPTTMLLCGAFGLWLGIDQFRKMKVQQSRMKPKHIYVLIALGAMFSLYGFFRMWNDIPTHTSIVLIGAFILGMGTLQLRIKRGRTTNRIRTGR